MRTGTKLLAIYGIIWTARKVRKGIRNKIEGRTFFGKELPGNKTRVDWEGNIVLGSDDYRIEEA